MRLTQTLNRQHLGFMFKKHWLIQGKRVPLESGAEYELAALGIKVREATDIMKFPKYDFTKLDIVGYKEKAVRYDESHPNWNSSPAYIYGDNNVLIEGVKQAQILTKSIKIEKLPGRLEELLDNTKIPDAVDRSMRQAVLMSHVLDAEQEKTAIIKDPFRPAYVFPRNYGITDSRKNKLIISKLLFHVEKMAGRTTTSTRKIVNNVYFVVPCKIENNLVQYELHVDTLLCSKKRLNEFEDEANYDDMNLPSITPMNPIISLPTTNIYEPRNIYPISEASKFGNPHTIFIHYSPLDVKHLHETPVTEDQIESRNLLKAFTVATAKARQLYGDEITTLPRPITVQSVETDGKSFYFGVFQLRTLNFNASDMAKNRWYTIPKVDLFAECRYKNGRPILTDYNSRVLKLCKAFYSNN